MPLHPVVADVLAQLPPHAPGPVVPADLRAFEESQVPPLAERLPLASVTDTTALTPTGEIPIRVYRAVAGGPTGILFYLHGGAFFLGSLETHDHVARTLAQATGLTVIAVDYRRAPEAPFPAGLEDCYEAIRWVAANGDRFDWDGRTLAVAGDSSGGTFVAAIAAMAHDAGYRRITHQVMFYPSLDLAFPAESYPSLTENAVGYGLETAGLAPFNAFYIESGADPADPLVSPIRRTNLAGLPPALIVTAEFDPLRDEGELYAERLRAAGVPTVLRRVAGANHGFVQNFTAVPEFATVFADTAAFLAGEDVR